MGRSTSSIDKLDIRIFLKVHDYHIEFKNANGEY